MKDFARIAKPLHKLVRKDENWNWKKEQEKTFKELKKMFTIQLVLVVPDLNKKIRVEADASEYATENILSMRCKDNKWRSVAFISKSLNKTERNYEIHNREILAIIQCLEK